MHAFIKCLDSPSGFVQRMVATCLSTWEGINIIDFRLICEEYKTAAALSCAISKLYLLFLRTQDYAFNLDFTPSPKILKHLRQLGFGGLVLAHINFILFNEFSPRVLQHLCHCVVENYDTEMVPHYLAAFGHVLRSLPEESEFPMRIPGVGSKFTEGMLNNGFFDMQLKVEGEAIPCHKTFLLQSTGFFELLLKTTMKESGQDLIELHEVEASTVKLLVSLLYSTSVVVPSIDDLLKLIYAANKFQMKHVEEAIAQSFNTLQITIGSWEELWKCSQDLLIKPLEQRVLSWLLGHWMLLDLNPTEFFTREIMKKLVEHMGSFYAH